MKLVGEPITDVKLFRPFVADDLRGKFVKTFHNKQLSEYNIHLDLKEEFYSISNQGVLRGMHFQVPPHDHNKFIYCTSGAVLDVILDLRKNSKTFGKAISLELSAQNYYCLFVPRGYAHGFLSLEDNTCLVYKTDCEYEPNSDIGLLWNSFDFIWPQYDFDFIVSDRDKSHVKFIDFESPF
jgi:dTDP-4-dehydrorhamnose 3,5-epimerase